MLAKFVLPLFVLCTVGLLANAEQDYYTAGVVEFHNSRASTAKERLEENLQAYVDIITSDLARETDILVFPESTLNSQQEFSFVPNPSIEVVAPCDDKTGTYADFLIELSCQARNVSKYLVVDLSERDICVSDGHDPRPCASNGFNMFNTNVVFDRQGYVISRYRKNNLWGENGNNITYLPDYGYFDTDFGVRFGHFICFDILFYTPAQEMVNKMGISHFLYPAMWFSQLPFLTANQMHVAWSYGNDVTLLAAGASNPAYGNSGTGIYAGRHGPLTTYVKTTGGGVRQLFVAKVPKLMKKSFDFPIENLTQKYLVGGKSATEATDEVLYLKRDRLELYESVVLDLSAGNSYEQKLCTSTEFCCEFRLIWRHLDVPDNSLYYHYRLGVFDGLRSEVAPTTNRLKNCALFSCLTDDIMDCGNYFGNTASSIDSSVIRPQVEFERIEISAQFPMAEHSVIMPNSLKTNILPVPVEHFEWHEEQLDTTRYFRFILNTTTDDLLTFSLYGNFYDTPSHSGASLAVASMFALVATTICLHFA